MSKATELYALIIVTTGVVWANRLSAGQDTKTVSHCSNHRFFNEITERCQDCSLCPPGAFIKSRCRRTKDTKCKGCRKGYFSTSYTRFPGRCRKCSECGMRPVIQKCTKTSDTVCGDCPLGTYPEFVSGLCVQCSYCYLDVTNDIPVMPECQRAEIPSSHQCIMISFRPYEAPFLIPKTDERGRKYFISSAGISFNNEKEAQEIRSSAAPTAQSTAEMIELLPSTKKRGQRRKPNDSHKNSFNNEREAQEITPSAAITTQSITEMIDLLPSTKNQGQRWEPTDSYKDAGLGSTNLKTEPRDNHFYLILVSVVVGSLFLALTLSLTIVWCLRRNAEPKAQAPYGIVVKKGKLDASYAQLLDENASSNYKV